MSPAGAVLSQRSTRRPSTQRDRELVRRKGPMSSVASRAAWTKKLQHFRVVSLGVR